MTGLLEMRVQSLHALADESRLRICALLASRELCVTDLTRVLGLAQSRVSTHLARLREAGFVQDRRSGSQSFYSLAETALDPVFRTVLSEACQSGDPTLNADLERLSELERERRGDLPDNASDDLDRDYSPGRTWQSLAAGVSGLLELGDVLDVGSGDGAAAAQLAPRCQSLTCIDVQPRALEMARDRLSAFPHVRVESADVHELPYENASFDQVSMFHTLTQLEQPQRALAQCARVLKPEGRLVLLCLEQHEHEHFTARYGEIHPGFSARSLRSMLSRASLSVVDVDVVSREPKRPHLRVLRAICDKTRGKKK